MGSNLLKQLTVSSQQQTASEISLDIVSTTSGENADSENSPHRLNQKQFSREANLCILYMIPTVLAITFAFIDFEDSAAGRPINWTIKYLHDIFGGLWGFFNCVIFSFSVPVVSPRTLRDTLSTPLCRSFFQSFCERACVTENLLFLLDFQRLVQKYPDYFRPHVNGTYLSKFVKVSQSQTQGGTVVMAAGSSPDFLFEQQPVAANQNQNDLMHDLGKVVSKYVQVGSDLELNLPSDMRKSAAQKPSAETTTRVFKEVYLVVEGIHQSFLDSPEYERMIDCLARESETYGRNVFVEFFVRVVGKWLVSKTRTKQ